MAELIAYIRENVVEGGAIYLLGGGNAVTAELDTIEGYQVKRLATLNIPLNLSSDSYTADAAGYIKAQNVTSGYVLGGTSVLSKETVQTVFALEDTIE